MKQSVASPSVSKEAPSPKLSLKRSFFLFAKFSGLFALARTLTSRKTRILAYHGVWLGEGHFGNFLYMSEEKFAARMALLEKWGYPVVPLTEIVGKKTSHRCPTVITIDDGWYSTWSAMLPALEKHHYPATIYLTTYYCHNQVPVIDVALNYCFSVVDTSKGVTVRLPDYDFEPIRIDTEGAKKTALSNVQAICASLENDEERQEFLKAVCEATGVDHGRLIAERWFHLMSGEEVKNAARRGISFEAHTHHHRIAHQGINSLEAEIAINRESIHKLTQQWPEHFCYPSGRYTNDLWPILEKCPIASATTTEIGLMDESTPRYAIPRVLDGQEVSELEFEAEMSGFMELLRLVRRVGRSKK